MEATTKRVVILRGVSGSGKSTFADQLLRDTGPVENGAVAALCSADSYFTDPATGEYHYDMMKQGESHSECLRQFVVALQDGIPLVIVDNVNSRLWEYQNYIEIAKLAGYAVEIEEFRVETREQVKIAAARQTHGVPLKAILWAWYRWEHDPRANIYQVSTSKRAKPA